MCGPPYEALWHPPGHQGSWESKRIRLGRTSERLPFSLLAMGLQRSRGRRLEQQLATDSQAKGILVASLTYQCPFIAYFIQPCPWQDLLRLRKQTARRTPRNQPCHCSRFRPGLLPAYLTPPPLPQCLPQLVCRSANLPSTAGA